jgi:hypothetical protein
MSLISSSGQPFHQTPLVVPLLRAGWVGGGAGVEHRPYLENCTVDASIFVAKL